MKVALTCNNYPPEFRGGTERVVQALARGLRVAGDDVIVISGTEEASKDGAVEDDEGIPVFRIGLRAGEGYGLNIERPRIQRAIQALLDAHGVDVLHVHHWSHLTDAQVRLARRVGLGVVVTLHDMWTSCGRFFRLPPAGADFECPTDAGRETCIRCVDLDFQEGDAWVRERMTQRDRDIKAELRAAHAIAAPSVDCADACLDHHEWLDDRPGIEVLPHGLLEEPASLERSPLGVPLRVGTFGNLNAEKGVLDLVAAMAGIKAELHLYGGASDDFRQAVADRAKELDVRMSWHGPYGDAGRHPALDLDLAVFPSRCRETYGLVVDEALSHGTPVIVSDGGALPERVARGGGLGFPAGDVDALAATIRGLIDERDAYHLLRASIPTEFPTVEGAVIAYRHLYAKAFAAAKVNR